VTTRLYTHRACLDHDTGPGHPESPERLRRLLERLKTPEYAALEWRDAPKADRPLLAKAHRLKYVSDVFAAIPE
jgi:acetoin utilization deacetylase AcuC-like enzyme